MSQAPQSHDDGPIQTPKQLILAVIVAFVLPITVIALLVNYVNSVAKEGAGSNALAAQAVAARIMPVAAVQVKAVTAAAGSRAGEEVFKGQCASCHAAGALGAPKYGDAAAWAPRIGQGLETLWDHAMKGKNAMPPQGGGEYADIEIKRAVAYMANAGGAKFEMPAAPAAAASDAAPAASAP
jgi:cytochrome c5